MAIALRNSNKGAGASSTSHTITLTGVQQDDWVVVGLVGGVATNTWTAPDSTWECNFTSESAASGIVAWKKLGASPPTSWTFTTNSAVASDWVVAAYSGVHATQGVTEFQAARSLGLSANCDTPSIRTYADNSLAVRIALSGTNTAITAPGGVTSRQSQNLNKAIMLADEAIAVEGLCGTRTFTVSASAAAVGETIILHPDTAPDYPSRYWMTDTLVASPSNVHYATQATQPADAAMAGPAGWNYGTLTTTGNPEWCYMDSGTEVARTTTTAPNWHQAASPTLSNPSASRGDCFVVGPLTGTIPTKHIGALCVIRPGGGGSGQHKIRYRFFRCDDAAGTNPSEIGSGADSNTTQPGNNSQPDLLAELLPASSVTFTAQYLLVQVIWNTTTAGTSTAHDADLRKGNGHITVPALQAATVVGRRFVSKAALTRSNRY